MSDRGRSAERIPIGIDSVSQKTAPPKTSEAVTGASCPIRNVDGLSADVGRARAIPCG